MELTTGETLWQIHVRQRTRCKHTLPRLGLHFSLCDRLKLSSYSGIFFSHWNGSCLKNGETVYTLPSAHSDWYRGRRCSPCLCCPFEMTCLPVKPVWLLRGLELHIWKMAEKSHTPTQSPQVRKNTSKPHLQVVI